MERLNIYSISAKIGFARFVFGYSQNSLTPAEVGARAKHGCNLAAIQFFGAKFRGLRPLSTLSPENSLLHPHSGYTSAAHVKGMRTTRTAKSNVLDLWRQHISSIFNCIARAPGIPNSWLHFPRVATMALEAHKLLPLSSAGNAIYGREKVRCVFILTVTVRPWQWLDRYWT